jgi:hypothetical protein
MIARRQRRLKESISHTSRKRNSLGTNFHDCWALIPFSDLQDFHLEKNPPNGGGRPEMI